MARADANAKVIADWVARTPWIDFLARDPALRSNTSVCLKVVDPAVSRLAADAQAAFVKGIAAALEKEGVAYDIDAYRDAPPGLRIWCGSTVERSDVEALTLWLDWAYAKAKDALAQGGVIASHRIAAPARRVRPHVRPCGPTLQLSEVKRDTHASQSSHLRCAFARRRRDLQGSRPRGRFPAQSRQGQGQACRDDRRLRRARDPLGDQGHARKCWRRPKSLKVIGRAGIGVDNVDIPAATARGIIVMNTPFGNSITTAEHAITLMLALARQIPEADASTRAGKWEKNKFLGVEIFGKTLGVIGCGNIGSIVADRAIGLKMKVIAYDPFLSAERALDLGVEKVELDELWRRADFITLHTPLTDKTRNIINAETLAPTKKGVRLINCARGELVDEAALREALKSGHVAGAALDVFREEPATQNPLFGLPNVVCTPHLGASTMEAQENVALQVAEQMSDYLLRGAISNAVNFPSISAEEAPKLKPFVALAEKLGSFAGQLTETGIKQVQISYEGVVAQMNTKALTSAAIAGLLRPMLQDVNVVSAPIVAKERGIVVEETRREARGRLRKPDHRHGRRPTGRRGRSPARCTPTAGRASSTSRASAWTPSSARRCSTSPTRTSRASSASSRRPSRRAPASTSRRSISAASPPAATPSRWSRSTATVPPDVLAEVQQIPNVQQVKPLRF